MAPEAKGAKFKARLEVEAGLVVDWRRGRIGPRGASWRPFRALAFVIAHRGSGPDSAERATLPRKRSDAQIAVNRRARSGEMGGKSEICREDRSHRGGSDGDGGDGARASILRQAAFHRACEK